MGPSQAHEFSFHRESRAVFKAQFIDARCDAGRHCVPISCAVMNNKKAAPTVGSRSALGGEKLWHKIQRCNMKEHICRSTQKYARKYIWTNDASSRRGRNTTDPCFHLAYPLQSRIEADRANRIAKLANEPQQTTMSIRRWRPSLQSLSS